MLAEADPGGASSLARVDAGAAAGASGGLGVVVVESAGGEEGRGESRRGVETTGNAGKVAVEEHRKRAKL